LPAAADLVDVASLTDSLATERFRSFRGQIVFSIVYDKDGLRHSEVVQTTLHDTTRAALTRVVDALIRKPVPAPQARAQHWGWQLGIVLDSPPAFKVGHQEMCLPELRSAPATLQQTALARRSARQPLTEQDRVRVRIRVDENGNARGAVIRASISGVFDAAAASAISSQLYWPMLIDRIPVPWEFEAWFP
jgi:hypothetical protein